MCCDLEWGSQFKRDYRLMIKQNRDITLLDSLISDLYNGIPLPPNFRDHKLVGNFAGYRECHIAGVGDWLLIYKVREEKHGKVLALNRTGSHSELFGI
jgi:mRNA interferase YafQ